MSPIQQLFLGTGSAVASKNWIDDCFSTFLYTGNSTSQNVTNGIDLAGEGGMVWAKKRSASQNHVLADTVRGITKYLNPNDSAAEVTDSERFLSVSSTGFAVGDEPDTNGSGSTYASWSFRRASGFFDVVKFTTTNTTNQRVSHSLGCIPGLILLKNISASQDWLVYHRSLGEDKYLQLSTTDAAATFTGTWGPDGPTSTDIGFKSNGFAPTIGDEYIAYIFAGGESTAATARSVDFDGSGDYLTVAGPGALGTSTDFTMECWVYLDDDASGTHHRIFSANEGSNSDEATQIRITGGEWQVYIGRNTSSDYWNWTGGTADVGQWYHLALVRNGSNNAFYVNGVSLSSGTGSHDVTITTLVVGGGYGTEYLDGRVSNARFTQGQALYTSNFTPPTSALTTTSQGATGSNVKLLCCQSTSSTTAATVTPSGSITANGDPYASSQTIQLATEITLTWPSSIKWDGGIAPTLDQSNLSGTDVNVINLLTRDEGVTWYGWETVSKSATSYQLWLWGYNVEGMLGQNNVAARSSPVQVSGHWSENIETREKSTLASKVDGTLWSWGSNDEGRLGHNNLVQYSSPVQIPGTTWDKVMTSHTGG